ncbi:mitochondrial carrier domain-containing protein [Morchella snyderi]|nr:mitochondrial carrier domain-containing protein [Morchella snyderi]
MANNTNHLHLDGRRSSDSFRFTDHAPHSSSNPYRPSSMSAVDAFEKEAGAEAEVEITAAQKMLAACSGSLLTSLLVTPLDVVRVRLQSQHHTPAHRSSTLLRSKIPLTPLTFTSTTAALPPHLGVTACCREVFWLTPTPTACLAAAPSLTSCQLTATSIPTAVANHRINGTFEGLVKIAKHEGLPSLWRGLSPTLLMAIPANVIYFTGYDSLRDTLAPLGPTAAPLLAGSAARTIAATVISPVELFRTRLQAAAAADHTFASTLAGVRAMVAAEGVASLWRGLGLTLWRDVPFSGVYWFGYEMVKARLRREREHSWHAGAAPLQALPRDIHAESTFVDAFVAGAASGAVAAMLTTPFDVGKTRRQVAMQVGGGGSMAGLLWGIWRVEGVAGLMRGCVPRMLKVAPACAIMISSYEVGKKAAARMNSRRAAL